MSNSLQSAIRDRIGGIPLKLERHVQDILLAGFFLLLVLIGAVGFWSERSLRELEAATIASQEEDSRHLALALTIDETNGKMAPEVSMVLAFDKASPLRMVAKGNLNTLKSEMDALLADGRKSRIGDLPEFNQVEASFNAFWAAVQSDDPLAQHWDQKRDQLNQAIHALEVQIRDEREENDKLDNERSRRARQNILLTTAGVLIVGLIVTTLTFLELRRILNRLGRAYRQSEDSRDYLKSLLDSLVSGVIVIANDGVVTIANRSLIQQAGLTGKDPVGMSYGDLFSGNESLTQIVSERLESGVPNHRYCGRVEMGDRRLFDTYASPLSVRNQQRGLILVFVDVTDMERAQRELTRNRTLSAVGQMTAQVAHEIKNPLGSINLAIDLLRRRSAGMNEDDLEVIGVIERSIKHLGRIVGELLEFSRPKDLNLTRININRLLEDVLPMVADRSSAKNITFERQFSDSLSAGEYDEAELRKLFINLVINAIDASGPGQAIILRTGMEEAGNLVIDVEDHGCGMDAETQRRLFEPFYTTKKMGTGLGMAIAKKIAELHRGDLSVKSRQGEGTTISVRLPLNAAGAASAD